MVRRGRVRRFGYLRAGSACASRGNTTEHSRPPHGHPMDAVAIEDVTKTYSAVTAVDGLSLTVPKGSVYGFIGPNGSGKSTTLRIIMRILVPDRGRVTVLGEGSHGAAHDRIGYLPEE